MCNERKYSLDVLRIIATILIIFHHYGQVTGLYLEGHINYWNGRFYFGYVVEFFFLLSGYFMYRYIGKITNGLTFKKFFLPRALRLLPLVFISGVTYEVLLGIYQKVCGGDWFGVSITVWGVIINALGVQDGWAFANPMVNNPTWYISVLLLCYIVFYLLTYLGKQWQIPHTYLFAFMVLLGCGAQTYGLNLPFLNGSSCRGYYAFFFGVLLAEWLEKLNAAKKSQNIYIYILGKRRFGRIPVMHDGIQMGVGSQRYQLSDDILVLPSAYHHFQQRTSSKAVRPQIYWYIGENHIRHVYLA